MLEEPIAYGSNVAPPTRGLVVVVVAQYGINGIIQSTVDGLRTKLVSLVSTANTSSSPGWIVLL